MEAKTDSICNSSRILSLINDLFALSNCHEITKLDDLTSMERFHLAQLQANFNVANIGGIIEIY